MARNPQVILGAVGLGRGGIWVVRRTIGRKSPLARSPNTLFSWVDSGTQDMGDNDHLYAKSKTFTNPFNQSATCTLFGGLDCVDDDIFIVPLGTFWFGSSTLPGPGPHNNPSISFSVTAGQTIQLDLWNVGVPNTTDGWAVNIMVSFTI